MLDEPPLIVRMLGFVVCLRRHRLPASLHLAITEQTCAGMSLGQWRRSARLAEVGCPLPVSDLRHVFQVLSNVVVVLVQLPVERVDYVGNL